MTQAAVVAAEASTIDAPGESILGSIDAVLADLHSMGVIATSHPNLEWLVAITPIE
jgi:hypothetical protein